MEATAKSIPLGTGCRALERPPMPAWLMSLVLPGQKTSPFWMLKILTGGKPKQFRTPIAQLGSQDLRGEGSPENPV